MASATSGLSRRRGANLTPSGVASASSSPSSPGASAPSSSSSRPGTPGAAKVNGGGSANVLGASTGGHRVAFDERDLETGEEKLMPKLTLMEEVLLLGLKDKQGYLSFWNDNISYTLRGCIILELALRHRIAMVKDPNRRRFPLADRYIEVVDERLTGEVLLDEALKMMKVSERMSVGTWIDLMSGECRLFDAEKISLNSIKKACNADIRRYDGRHFDSSQTGETWNVMKIGYQLKQVRERLAKGLVDKGVLRTEKRNFLLFDMATHPVSDPTFKEDVLKRTLGLLTARTAAVPTSDLYGEHVRYRTIRAVSMVCAAFAANVLENALVHLGYDSREAAFAKCDELLAEFSQWPFGAIRSGSGGSGGIGVGSSASNAESANLAEINRLARAEIIGSGPGKEGISGQAQRELHLEVVAAACEIFRRMDSLL